MATLSYGEQCYVKYHQRPSEIVRVLEEEVQQLEGDAQHRAKVALATVYYHAWYHGHDHMEALCQSVIDDPGATFRMKALAAGRIIAMYITGRGYPLSISDEELEKLKTRGLEMFDMYKTELLEACDDGEWLALVSIARIAHYFVENSSSKYPDATEWRDKYVEMGKEAGVPIAHFNAYMLQCIKSGVDPKKEDFVPIAEMHELNAAIRVYLCDTLPREQRLEAIGLCIESNISQARLIYMDAVLNKFPENKYACASPCTFAVGKMIPHAKYARDGGVGYYVDQELIRSKMERQTGRGVWSTELHPYAPILVRRVIEDMCHEYVHGNLFSNMDMETFYDLMRIVGTEIPRRPWPEYVQAEIDAYEID